MCVCVCVCVCVGVITTHGLSDHLSSRSAGFCATSMLSVLSIQLFVMCRQNIQQFLTCTQTHSVPSNERPFKCHQEACGISWTKWDAREADGHERGPIRSHTRIKVGVYSAAWWIHTFWSHPCPEPWPLYPLAHLVSGDISLTKISPLTSDLPQPWCLLVIIEDYSYSNVLIQL